MSETAGQPISRVECVSDWTYAGRPLAVTWEGRRFVVEQVESEWQAPDGRHYRVTCMGGRCFELAYLSAEDNWRIIPRSA